MFVGFEIDNDKNIIIADYINKPIVNNDKAIGVIINAVLKDQKLIIEAEIWDNFISTNVIKCNINDKWNCININFDL